MVNYVVDMRPAGHNIACRKITCSCTQRRDAQYCLTPRTNWSVLTVRTHGRFIQASRIGMCAASAFSHGMIMAESMAQLHMHEMTSWQSCTRCGASLGRNSSQARRIRFDRCVTHVMAVCSTLSSQSSQAFFQSQLAVPLHLRLFCCLDHRLLLHRLRILSRPPGTCESMPDNPPPQILMLSTVHTSIPLFNSSLNSLAASWKLLAV